METMAQAIGERLGQSMAARERVLLLGAEVREGGVYGVCDGLFEKFGPDRVLEPGGGEAGLLRFAEGLAACGWLPIVELDSVADLLAGLGALGAWSRGLVRCPVSEADRAAAELALGAYPELRVAVPSSSQSASLLVERALAGPGAFVLLEPRELYSRRMVGAPLAQSARSITHLEGRDVTLACWGAAVPLALSAAQRLGEQQIGAEVLELVELRPLDEAALLESVSRTGRIVIVPGDGTALEIAALVAEKAILRLEAPVVRLKSRLGVESILDQVREAVFF